MEAEVGLEYGKQFYLLKEERGEYHFAECIDGIPISRRANGITLRCGR